MYFHHKYSERKDPCPSYRPNLKELLLLLLFLVVDKESVETAETILSLEILKEIFSSLSEMAANIARIWKKSLKEEPGKCDCSLKRSVLGVICMGSKRDKLLASA